MLQMLRLWMYGIGEHVGTMGGDERSRRGIDARRPVPGRLEPTEKAAKRNNLAGGHLTP